MTVSVHAPLVARSRLLTGRVVTAHRRAANLLAPDGQFWAVVDAGAGNGPATVVLEGGAPLPWREGEQVRLHLPAGAARWEPPATPAFQALRSPAREVAFHALWEARPHGGCLTDVAAVLEGGRASGDYASGIHLLGARRWPQAVAALAGLGPGLTPSGDDLLCGYVSALHRLRYPLAAALAAVLCVVEARATTPLSLHYLRWAAQGVSGEHALHWLDHVITGRPVSPERVLAHGATSGADWAAGALLALHHVAAAKENVREAL